MPNRPRPIVSTTSAAVSTRYRPAPQVASGGGAAATTSVRGSVLRSAAVTDLAAFGTQADLAAVQTSLNVIQAKINDLLAKQRTAGQVSP